MNALQVLHCKLAVTSRAIHALKERCGTPVTVFSYSRSFEGERTLMPSPLHSAFQRRVVKHISPAHPEWGTYVGLKRQATLLHIAIHLVKEETHKDQHTRHLGVLSHVQGDAFVTSMHAARHIVARLHVQLEKGKSFTHLEKACELHDQAQKVEVHEEEPAVV